MRNSPTGTGLRFGAAAAVLALAAGAPALPPFQPLRFQEMSTLSGGTIELPAAPSDAEKTVGAFADTDGDGWDDLIYLTGEGHPFQYFRNVPDGSGGRTFEPFPANHGLDTGACFERDGAALTAGDVDGDGDVDLFVGVGYSPLRISGQNILMLNDGTGRFVDATISAGLLDGNHTTCGAVLWDMDLDGDLDLFTCNTDFSSAGKFGDGRAHLMRNMLVEEGTLRFVDVIESSGIDERGRSVWAVSAVDFDLDGDGDLLITHDIQGLTQLFRNDGTGRFTEVTGTVGGGEGDDAAQSSFGNDTPSAMGADWADIDNDGDLDLYLTDINTNALYVANADGTLAERGESAGVRAGLVTWGCVFADFDLDGFADLHVAGGDTYFNNRTTMRSWLYHNMGDGTFVEEFAGSGLRHDPGENREDGTSISDYDRDGRVDLLSVRAYRTESSPYLYRNVTDVGEARWISVTLRGNGTASNRSAIGAHVRVWPRDGSGNVIRPLVQQRHVVSQHGRNSVSSFDQVVGLGPEAATVDVEVTWPRSGPLESRRDLYVGLAIPDAHRIVLDDALPAYPHAASASASLLTHSTPFSIPVTGAGGPGAPPVAALEDAPEWLSLAGSGAQGWSIEGTAPADAPSPLRFVVFLHDPAVPGSGTRQAVTLSLVPPLVVDEIQVKGKGKKIVLLGRNIPPIGLLSAVDGILAKKTKVKALRRPTPEGSTARVTVTTPFKGRGERAGYHVLRIWDANVEPRTTTVDYTVP